MWELNVAVKAISRVAFESSAFLYLTMCVGNTIETAWLSMWSFVYKCISITNTNFEKKKLDSSMTYDLHCTLCRAYFGQRCGNEEVGGDLEG